MNRSFVISVFTSVLIFSGCKNDKTPLAQATASDDAVEVPDDFRLFYDRFHEDTSYQSDHIIFPLDGLPANADTLAQGADFKWPKENWRWHRPMDPKLTGYSRQWEVLSPEMIVENIVETTSNIGMMRRFAKMGDEWMLIYYAGMNPIP